jgi:CubicO group peptidase (beta-lactamase class C family)
MSDAQPLVSVAYGTSPNPMEIDEGGGGLSAAATDLARLIAILISQKDSPALTRATLASMLSAGAKLTAAGQGRAGYGFDALIDQGGGQFYGQKGGSWNCCGAILQFNKPQGWGFARLQASDGAKASPHSHPLRRIRIFPES